MKYPGSKQPPISIKSAGSLAQTNFFFNINFRDYIFHRLSAEKMGKRPIKKFHQSAKVFQLPRLGFETPSKHSHEIGVIT